MGTRFLFLFLVFITEWAILMLEMAAFKMFIPHFGSSLHVWGNIIGIIMIGSSIGYYAGGKISDKYPKETVLIYIVLATGLFIIAIPFIAPFLLSMLHNMPSLLAASFLSGIILFGLPAFLIELAPPFVIRLQNKALATTGSITGSVYSVSTLGGILGIIVASFITLPLIGVRETIWLTGIILLAAGGLCLIAVKRKNKTYA